MPKGNMSLDFILCRHVSFLAIFIHLFIQPVVYGTQSRNTAVTEIYSIKTPAFMEINSIGETGT